MIACEFDAARPGGRIVLRPNRSWTWRANTFFVATLTILSGFIALFFAFQGMWLILPFSVLEMSVLLACLYYCVRRTHRQEVLTFSLDQLVLERGVNRPQSRREFERYFTRIFVRPASHPWRDKRVSLRCRDTEVEIGSFLSSGEKDDLIRALTDMIQRLDAPPLAS